MKLRIEKWGDTLAVRLPAELTMQAALQEGDKVDIALSEDGSLTFALAGPDEKSAFLALVDDIHRTFPATTSVMHLLRSEEHIDLPGHQCRRGAADE